jgi:hypothetical protein
VTRTRGVAAVPGWCQRMRSHAMIGSTQRPRENAIMNETSKSSARQSTSAEPGPDLLEQYGCGPIQSDS